MSKIKNGVQKQGLSQIRTWVVDDNPFSDYFRLTQIPDILSGGKTGFLINGSPNLVRTTEVLVEIVDADGNTIFLQPIKNYNEGLARVISIEVYEDTPPGPATITILGELAFDKSNIRVPNEWIGTYNVKWQKIINVDPRRPNTTPIRLYNKPKLDVVEHLHPFRESVTGSIVSQSVGSLVGQYIPGGIQFIGDDPSNQQRIVTRPYTNVSTTSPIFVKESINGTIEAVINGYPFTSSFDSITNTTTAKLQGILTGSDLSPVDRWAASSYTLRYNAASTFITSSLVRSLAKIKLSNLTTFTGDIQRAKFYSRGVDLGETYQLLDDVVLEDTDLIVSHSTIEDEVKLGQIINQTFINQNWEAGTILNKTTYSSTGNITASYSSNELTDALFLTGSVGSNLYITGSSDPVAWAGINQPVSISANVEYTFIADMTCIKSGSGFDARIGVYLSGSVLSNGVGNQLGFKIVDLQVPSGQLRRVFYNHVVSFIAPETDLAKLKFVVYGGEWHISNVQLKSTRQSGFNPDEITIKSSIVGRRFERLQFKAELYDANSNLVPLDIETDPIYFDGGNLVFRGSDTRIDGTLTLAPNGSGPMLSSTTSGSFIGIFSESRAYAISSQSLNSYTGSPLISIFSGSSPFRDSPFVPAIGFQIVTSQSYLHYDSNSQRLLIKGEIAVLPGSSFSSSLVSGTLALTQIQQLVNGTGSQLPTGTFINGYSITSPIIAGNTGYFSNQFGVGNIAGGRGIILTSLGYTSSVTTSMSGSPAIYIGSGQHASPQTPFLVASSSTGPVMSLSDVFILEPSASTYQLTIKGRLNVVDPSTDRTSSYNDIRKVISNRLAFGPFGFYICNL